ncbi:MAG: methyltransferase domain-containing protein [Spirochaetaceae bacterium]|nr:methyltransferase domain-containing protein [Myxococcales bacterium]MCB9724735.1 methyltransferase domain-containing protein [Spirochaetaceae bacterium]
MTRGNLRPVRRPRRRNLAGFPLVLTILAAALACATGPEPRPEGLPSGINDVFLAKDLDVDAFVERFEGESRAVYAQRHAIVEALELSEGDRVADIGAGTGFFSFLFAEAVGETGRVYAVEISPRFLDLLRERAALQRLDTPQVVEGTELSIERPVVEGTGRSIERQDVEGTERSAGLQVVEGTERSVELPPDSVDLAFLCDVYHHFEYPTHSLESLYRAVRPGGALVLIEFHRIPGVTSDFLLEHVRAGQDVFTREIEAAGFVLDRELPLDGLEDNYVLRFVRPE